MASLERKRAALADCQTDAQPTPDSYRAAMLAIIANPQASLSLGLEKLRVSLLTAFPVLYSRDGQLLLVADSAP